MPVVRALVEIPCDSALPEDAAQNVFHFFTTLAPTSGNLDDIATALLRFYSVDTPTAPLNTGDYIASQMNPGAATVTFYNLSDSIPRTPIRTDPLAFVPSATTTSLPREAAICLSFQGAALSGVPQARRRGRVYIGPLSGFGVSLDNLDMRPNIDARTHFCEAMERLGVETAADSVHWHVYSPTNNGSVVITNGWVDNELDSQRRRGRAATLRTTWS